MTKTTDPLKETQPEEGFKPGGGEIPIIAVEELPLSWDTFKGYSTSGCVLHVETSLTGRLRKTPVKAALKPGFSLRDFDIVNYVFTSLMGTHPGYITPTLESPALMNLATYLRRYKTSSPHTLSTYIWNIMAFCSWVGEQPDGLVKRCLDDEGFPDVRGVERLKRLLEEYVGELRARGKAPGTINNAIQPVRTLLKVNGIAPPGVLIPQVRVVYSDRAPRPEELQRMLIAGDLRDGVIVSILALGGFRVGTLAQLRYRHVREDLERGVVPIHIYVEAENNKGEYCNFDTFLGPEAAEYLKMYLESRRKGSPCGRMPPEEIMDDSPLIRNVDSMEPRPIAASRISQIVRHLYVEAGLIKRKGQRHYVLRTHSIRKYFRTQLAALGVNRDYINYMMGHKGDRYHDVKMKGVEFLRGVYAQADLRIKPRDKSDIYDFIEDLLKGRGLMVDRDLLKRAIVKPHRTAVWGEEERRRTIRDAFMKMLKEELLDKEAGY